MLANSEGISPNLDRRDVTSKNPGLVMAIARSVKGSIFARSCERF